MSWFCVHFFNIALILREICERMGVETIEAECCKDHVHMLIKIPPKYSVSYVMGVLKGKSTLIIFERYENLKYRYGNNKNNKRKCRKLYGIKEAQLTSCAFII